MHKTIYERPNCHTRQRTMDNSKRSILLEYFGTNARGLQAYLRAEERKPIVVNGQPPWLHMSEETHMILADAAGWIDARIQLDDAARVIQNTWRQARMAHMLANMAL